MNDSPKPGTSSEKGAAAAAAGIGNVTPLTNALEFQKSVTKRLNSMTDRQDSIQALSLWMIHHKTECKVIASCWLAAMKRAKTTRRLYLFYLANDVVQSCKKKNAKIYLLAFKNVLKDAVVLVRDAAIKHKIERLFHIWEERNTYFIDFIKELRELLNDREKVTAHVSAANFKPQDLLDSIRKVKMLETHVGMKQKQVANLKLDASRIEAVKLLKDRSHSHDFAKQFDDSYTKMQAYVKVLENEVAQREKLIELLENGQTFYEVQNDDAMVVANAYRNFGIRINNLKKRLLDYKDTLTDETDSPPPSPSAEAPSPGNTPPQDTSYDAAGEMDMELSESEDSPAADIIASEPYTPTSSGSLTDRLAALGATLPGVSSDPRQAAAGSYSPAEQLQREKAPPESQPAAGRSDKSVLKNLTEFAEKVKNPPPKDWSEFNRKRVEAAQREEDERLQAANEAARKAAEEEQARLDKVKRAEQAARLAVAEEAVRQAELEHALRQAHYEEAARNARTESDAELGVVVEADWPTDELEADSMNISDTVILNETVPEPSSSEYESNIQVSDSNPCISAQDSPQTSLNETPPDSAYVNQTPPGNVSITVAGSGGSTLEPMHSISWPPHSPPSSSQPAQFSVPNNTRPAMSPQHNVGSRQLRMQSPVKPPPIRSPVRPPSYSSPQRTTLASHIKIRELPPVQSPPRARHPRPRVQQIRHSSTVTVTIPPEPPLGRRISNEQQTNALQLLDNMHAGADARGSESGHHPGIAIQTVGANVSPIPNRNPALRNMTRAPQPPPNMGYNNYRPPAKRPYQGGYNNQYYY